MKIELFPPLSIHEKGKRDNQEDALWPDLPEEATVENRLYILCDGMGGYEHGEVASKTVCLTIPHVLRRSMSYNSEDLTDDDLLDCLERAYQELDKAAIDNSRKMGTTIALLYIGRKGITALHMGDSRIYHIRPNVGILYQSRDHSLVSELFQAGEISYEEMLNYPKKNIVTRAMMPGKDNRMHPDIIHITDIQPGDYFYLCSDGMLESMGNQELVSILLNNKTDLEKKQKLVEGTKDNLDNHSAWLIHIKDVNKNNDDEDLPNEELTSRCNVVVSMPKIVSENEISEDDVVTVSDKKVSLFQRIMNIFTY